MNSYGHSCFQTVGLDSDSLHSDLLNDYTPVSDLRSSSQNLLLVPLSNLKSYGDRTFSICTPKLSNFLPIHIKCSQSVSNSKSNLKTLLFKQAFN